MVGPIFLRLGGGKVTVTYIRPGKSKGYISIGIQCDDEKYTFSVSEDVYSDVGTPVVGDFIESDVFGIMKDADELYRANLKALRILSFADNSRIALMRKLINAGFSRRVCEAVVSDMVKLGYINEKRRLYSLIKDEVSLSYTGPRKLIPKLMAKGYSRGDIESVMYELADRGEIDFAEAKKRLIEKKLGMSPDREEVKKLLYKSGYDVC